MAALRPLIAALLVSLLPAAHAAYAYPSPPPTWGGAAGAWTYGGTAAANAPWINGSAAAQVTTQVGGRAVTVPATMRMAANAPSVVARAILSNPAMRLAPMLAWAAAGLLVYDAATGLWNREVPNTGMTWHVDQTQVAYSSSQAACEGAAQASLAGSQYTNLVVTVTPANATQHWCSMSYTLSGNNYTSTDFTLARGTNTCPSGNCPPSLVPATEADFDALPQAVPMPDAVARAADDVMPLPQELPELEPVSIPLGSPYPRNGEQWQDRIKVDPRNDTESPWRVDQRIESGPENEASETPSEEHPADPCESHPERAGCKALGTLEATPLPTVVAPLSITPDSGWATGGSYACPQNKVLNLSAVTVVVPFTMLCDVADMARPVVIGVAWVVAIFGFMGLSKRD